MLIRKSVAIQYVVLKPENMRDILQTSIASASQQRGNASETLCTVTLISRDGSVQTLQGADAALNHDFSRESLLDTLRIEVRHERDFRSIRIDLASQPQFFNDLFALRNRVVIEGIDEGWVKETKSKFIALTKRLERRDRWANALEFGGSSFAFCLIFISFLEMLISGQKMNTLNLVVAFIFFLAIIPGYIFFQKWKLSQVRQYFPVIEFRFSKGAPSAIEKRRKLSYVMHRDIYVLIILVLFYVLGY